MLGSKGHYTAFDSDPSRPFHYLFEICENMDHVPETDPPGLCGSGGKPRPGAAYQVINQTGELPGQCLELGAQTRLSSCSLTPVALRARFPLSLRYRGGASSECPEGREREFQIFLRCAPHLPDSEPFRLSGVEESAGLCTYSLFFDTAHTCPRECHPNPSAPIGRFNRSGDPQPTAPSPRLCSLNGLCATDWSHAANAGRGQARCFCNSGRTGADCSTEESTSKRASSTSIMLMLVLLALLAVGVLGGWVYLKVKRLATLSEREDSIAYGQLPQ